MGSRGASSGRLKGYEKSTNVLATNTLNEIMHRNAVGQPMTYRQSEKYAKNIDKGTEVGDVIAQYPIINGSVSNTPKTQITKVSDGQWKNADGDTFTTDGALRFASGYDYAASKSGNHSVWRIMSKKKR